MNPPFDRGQWQSHINHAAYLLGGEVAQRLWDDPDGALRWGYGTDDRRCGAVIVAVLPASAPGKIDLPGFAVTWSEPIAGAFVGTSIDVVIMKAVKQ
jgi:hypothetical protein